jgi:hypothetical protein
MDKSVKPFFFAALLYLASGLLFFLPVIGAGQILAPGDGLHSLQLLTQNRIWTDLTICGFSVLADPQAEIIYPLRILSEPFGWNFYVTTSFFLSALFTFGYAFSLTRSWPAAALAGLIYAFSGFHVSNLRHITMLESLIWLPLLLWSVRELRVKFSLIWYLVTLSATILFCLAGHPQMFVYGAALIGTYVLLEASLAPKEERLRYFLIATFALLCGLAVCSVPIVPCFEYSTLSWRWAMSYKSFVEWSVFPFQLLNFVFPYLFGGFKSTVYGVNYFGAYNPQTTSDYVGLIPFTFIPLALFAQPKDRITLFWLFWLGFAFLMSLGDAGLISRLIFLIPIYNKFRAPSRHMMEFTMAVSALSALGATTLTNGGLERARKTQKVVLYFLVVSTILAIAFAKAMQSRVLETHAGNFSLYPWSNVALGLPIALILVWAFTFKLSLDKVKYRWLFLLSFAILDLGSFALGAEYIADPKPYSVYNPPPHGVALRDDLNKTHQRFLSLRGNSGALDELPVNLSWLWSIPNATGYQSLLPGRISQLLNAPEGGFVLGPWADRINVPEGGFLFGDWSKPESTALDVLSVKYVTLPCHDNRYPPPQGERWRFVQKAGEALIYQNMRAEPRAWLVSNAVYMAPEKMLYTLQGLKYPSVDSSKTVLLEGEDKTISFPEDDTKQAEITSLKDTEMIVHTKSKADAFLVTSDSFYPGWEVEIDNKPAPLLHANYVVRSVLVPQGDHVVKFVFKSKAIQIGAIIGCAALLLGILAGLFLAYQKKK